MEINGHKIEPYANLQDAYLQGANLWDCIGNGREITTIQTARYVITYTSDVMQIGCSKYPISDWFALTDEEIAAMDPPHSLKWWRKWKPILQAILEC